MNDKYIRVAVVFYASRQHRRKTPPNLSSGKYCPHLNVKGDAEYLGVCFIDGEDVILGEKSSGTAELMYDQVDYHLLTPGAVFFIMEGPNKVGEGKTLDRWSAQRVKRRK